jgi:acyl-CoA hydrolase
MRIRFPSASIADMVFRVVAVDEEIRPKVIYRHLRLDDNVLEWSGGRERERERKRPTGRATACGQHHSAATTLS